MARMRKKVSRKKSSRMFKKSANRTHKKNVMTSMSMRGGSRL